MGFAERVLPLLYTPTIGTVCQRYFHLPITSHGVWLDATMDQDTMLHALRAHPLAAHVRVVVVTDGQRVLGLGDLGAGGMGICEGKSLLYTVAAAVPPHTILPVMLDVGTDNKALREDACYRGMRQPRLHGDAHTAVIDAFMAVLARWKPHVLVQFEDFGNATAFRMLKEYGTRACCFNDDIQGTACVALAVLLAASREASVSFAERPVLFLGAGEAGTGIADLLSLHLVDAHGLTPEQARRQCVFLDSKGLVCSQRLRSLQSHKRPYAHTNMPPCASLLEAVRTLRPAALVGVSTQAGAFDQQVLQAMAEVNARPIVLPLSNPTACAESTYSDALAATDGRVLFASGSPFAPVTHNGQRYVPDQANNAYVFPAIGHAAVLTTARIIPDDLFLQVARALSSIAPPGRLLPRFGAVLEASAYLMAAACKRLVEQGVGRYPDDFELVVADWRLQGRAGDAWEAYCRSRIGRRGVVAACM